MSERVSVVESGEELRDPRVETLGYIGGEGGYCEPLVVHHDGVEYCMLHEAHLKNDKADRWDADNWIMVHQKVAYGSREELLAAFDEVRRRLTVDEALDWRETDRTLGFDIAAELFTDSTSAFFAAQSSGSGNAAN